MWHFVLVFCFFATSLAFSIWSLLNALDLVKQIYFCTGVFALVFLHLSVFFAILRKRYKALNIYPKYFGFFSVFYAFIHFLNYFVFEKNMDVFRAFNDLFNLFKFSGFVSLLLLIFMLFGSFIAFLYKAKRLGALCLFSASVHFYLSAKVPGVFEYASLIISVLFLSLQIFNKNPILSSN